MDNYQFTTTARNILRWCFCFLLLSGLSGCALMHETSEPLAKIEADQIRLADDIHLARDGWPSARWWEEYQDPQLNALIDQALNEAPSMEVVRSQVDQARARVEFAGSITGIQAMAIATIDQMHVSEGGALGPYSTNITLLGREITDGPWYTAGILGIGGGYMFDFWGKHRSQINATIGLQNAQLAEMAAVELEISTAVTQIYYEIQATLHTVDLLQQAHEIVAATAVGHEARGGRGLESETLAQEARAQQLTIELQISAAENLVRQLREGLRALIGAHADNLPEIVQVPLPTLPANLPETLSYELLSRRPDLQAMHWLVQASLSQVEAAKASFYPSFDIKVFYGLTALHLDDLFRSGNQQFNLLPGVTLPIFDGGRLNANLKNATAASNMAIAQYNQAVLNAVKDVAIAGTRLEGLEEDERLQTEKLDAVTFLKDSAEAHYKQGLVDKVTAQKAKLPVNAEEIALLGIHRNQISQSIALVKALGGGYHAQNPDSVSQ